MTTEQRMLAVKGTVSLCARWSLVVMMTMFAASLVGGCSKSSFQLPRSLVSPYGAAHGEALWAVAPLRNESGVGVVDPLALTDTLAGRVHEVRGISVVPVNRTLGAMRALGLVSVERPEDALRLIDALGVDAIVIGSITAWNPYDPPTIGLSLALYGRGETVSAGENTTGFDPLALESAPSDRLSRFGRFESRQEQATDQGPLSAASEHIDGANHEVQMAVQAYAEGRHDKQSPLGWRRYLASMPLFTEFVADRLLEGLLDSERLRLARRRTALIDR